MIAGQRPTSIEVKNTPVSGTAQVLMSRLYQYDQAGNITQIKSDLGTTDYGYDRLSRLTQATPDQNLQTLGLPHEQYSYDAVHNRTSSGHQPGAWSYNQDHQLTHYPRTIPFNQAPPVDTSVTYTPQGHTQKETSSQWTKDYGYNAAERLTKYQSTNQGQSSPALEANYRYDPFGRRIAKSVKEASTATTYFVYGEQGLMGETDEQGKLTKGYGFNPIAAQQGLWSTDPIWQANASNGILTAQGTSFHYLHTDHLGTPQLATTKEGAPSWKAQSEAFGAAGVLQAQSSITMNLRFPGQYFDQETGSHYNFNRDYKPNQGRYTQSDPIGLKGGPNIFTYVSARPTVTIDDKGLVEWSGSVTSAGAVFTVGVMAMYYNLVSECLCGKRVRLKGMAVFGAAGFGRKYTVSGGGSTFYDNRPCPTEDAADGPATSVSIGSVFGGGFAVSATALGSIRSTWPPISTGLIGLDLSAVVMMGWSWGVGTPEPCCETK